MDVLLKLVFDSGKDCWLIPLKEDKIVMLRRRERRTMCVHPQGWWDSTSRYKDFWFPCMCGREEPATLISGIFLLHIQIRNFDSRDGQ